MNYPITIEIYQRFHQKYISIALMQSAISLEVRLRGLYFYPSNNTHKYQNSSQCLSRFMQMVTYSHLRIKYRKDNAQRITYTLCTRHQKCQISFTRHLNKYAQQPNTTPNIGRFHIQPLTDLLIARALQNVPLMRSLTDTHSTYIVLPPTSNYYPRNPDRRLGVPPEMCANNKIP